MLPYNDFEQILQSRGKTNPTQTIGRKITSLYSIFYTLHQLAPPSIISTQKVGDLRCLGQNFYLFHLQLFRFRIKNIKKTLNSLQFAWITKEHEKHPNYFSAPNPEKSFRRYKKFSIKNHA